MMKLAEEKKQTVRRQIASLRRTFTKLRQRDNELPQELRLDQREFVMDPHMEEQLRLETLEKVRRGGGGSTAICRIAGDFPPYDNNPLYGTTVHACYNSTYIIMHINMYTVCVCCICSLQSSYL